MTKKSKDRTTAVRGSLPETPDPPAGPGILLLKVWLVSSSFEETGFDALLKGQAEFDAGAMMEVDPFATVWLSDETAALVQLKVVVKPAKQPTYVAAACFAAQYEVRGTPAIPLEEFAWGNGLANLVPFVRAHLAHLTGSSRFPAYLLQPMNLAALQGEDRMTPNDSPVPAGTTKD
jgi:preprotein translocase subunit SecB